MLEEQVDAACPVLFARAVRGGLWRWLTFRQQVATGDLARHARFGAAGERSVAISGASGLVGSALADFLEAGGHSVLRFVRCPSSGPRQISWDPQRGAIEGSKLEGVDAVVHLAGESVAGGRWTAARKERIRASRVAGTRLIAETLAGLAHPPRTLINASAIGYYGDRGAERLDESSSAGTGFLADTCRAWEEATLPAERAGVRVIRLRIGVVLAGNGGALAQMLTPFRLGLGGPIGDGRQFISWIALDDLIGIVHHALFDATLEGAVNAVSPQALPNADFARQLGRVLSRPARIPLPRAAVSLGLGEMGHELLLAGARIEPARLTHAGFRFRHADLESALRFELRRFAPEDAGS